MYVHFVCIHTYCWVIIVCVFVSQSMTRKEPQTYFIFNCVPLPYHSFTSAYVHAGVEKQ